jgi:hypothetical protein
LNGVQRIQELVLQNKAPSVPATIPHDKRIPLLSSSDAQSITRWNAVASLIFSTARRRSVTSTATDIPGPEMSGIFALKALK